MPKNISIVFAHGLLADGSCFSKVMGPLQAEGYECLASQHGLDGLAKDVANVTRNIARASNPVLLVGHSYGGTLITHAGVDDRVRGLVYICALGPDENETSQAQQDRYPKTPIFAHIEVSDNRIWLGKSGVPYFAGDLPEEEQALVWATAMPPVPDLFDQKVDGTAWRTKRSWAIVGANDQTVQPQLERDSAERMGARTFELQSSHVPMLSQPKATLDIIREAAESL
ncbi:alpha/beta fold hydrolase [Arthrobacter sp. NPDC058192]|uniref:alpha/beta fold hydrolase n=1 Tax=Arthrobacter sp. NPDC058192 TaxID=3346372 RepID=UPI0036E33270